MKNIFLTFALAALVIISSCGTNETQEKASQINGVYENVDQMVEEAAKGIEEIKAVDFKALMDNGDPYVLIDVREKNEFDAGYIPGAVSIPRGVVEFRILKESFWDNEGMYPPMKEELLIIYCKKGSRGTLATASLKSMGFTNIKNLNGGWLEWISNFPDVKEKNETAGEGPVVEAAEDSGGC